MSRKTTYFETNNYPKLSLLLITHLIPFLGHVLRIIVDILMGACQVIMEALQVLMEALQVLMEAYWALMVVRQLHMEDMVMVLFHQQLTTRM